MPLKAAGGTSYSGTRGGGDRAWTPSHPVAAAVFVRAGCLYACSVASSQWWVVL